MQFTPRYLVNNRINIVANVAGFVTEYRPVYQRQIQVYKGIDNVLQFKLLNAEQKPVDVSAYTPKFVAFDENQNLIIEHTCTLVPGDDSAALRGLFTVTVTENDLLNVKDQFLHYNIYLVDELGAKSLTYSDSHFGFGAVIKVSSEAFPSPALSKEIQFLQSQENNSYWVTSAEYAEPGINGNDALHTIVIYPTAYVGTVTIQATLDDQIENGVEWADVQAITFNGSETEPVPVNFTGVFSYIRLKASADPANKITKVLIRN
jgi:hypothetical protein